MWSGLCVVPARHKPVVGVRGVTSFVTRNEPVIRKGRPAHGACGNDPIINSIRRRGITGQILRRRVGVNGDARGALVLRPWLRIGFFEWRLERHQSPRLRCALKKAPFRGAFCFGGFGMERWRAPATTVTDRSFPFAGSVHATVRSAVSHARIAIGPAHKKSRSRADPRSARNSPVSTSREFRRAQARQGC